MIKNQCAGPAVFVNAAAAGCTVGALFFLCFFGIPFDFNGDLFYIYDTVNTQGVFSLIVGILNPLTPAWFFSNDMVHLRPGQFLLMKLMSLAGQFHLSTAHLIACAGIVSLCTVLYLVLWEISRRKWFAWLGVLLYGTFPTHVYSMISIFPMDWQFLELGLVLCSIIFFWKSLRSSSASLGRFCLRLAVVIIMTWLAIKLKSSAKVLPCIFFVLLFVALGRSFKDLLSARFAIGMAAVMAMFVLAVPIVKSHAPSAKEKKSLKLNLEYAAQRTFQSRPEGEFPLLTPRRTSPGSLTENYGFVGGWIFWGALAVALARCLRSGRKCDGKRAAGDLFWPALVWFLFALAGFALGEPPLDANNRYLNYGLLPSVILLFACLFPGEEAGEGQTRGSRFLYGILGFCLVLTICQNIVLFGKWVVQKAGFQWALVQAQKDIFTDVQGRPPASPEELFRFYSTWRNRLIVMEWEGQDAISQPSVLEELRKNKKMYYLGRADGIGADVLGKHSDATLRLWKEISLYDAPTPALKVAKMLRTALGKKGKGKEINIFKLVVA